MMKCSSCGDPVPLKPVECPHRKELQAADAAPAAGYRLLAGVAAALVAGLVLGYMAAPASRPPSPGSGVVAGSR